MKFVSPEFLSPKISLAGLEISLLKLRNLGMHTQKYDDLDYQSIDCCFLSSSFSDQNMLPPLQL